jgi:cytoskeletal protein RodZ
METRPEMDGLSTAGVVHLPKWRSVGFLAIACLVSYAILTTLIVFQNRTIQAQRNVIHQLFKDRQRKSSVSSSDSAPGHVRAQNHGQSAGDSQAQPSSPSSQANSDKNSKMGQNSHRARNRAAVPPAEGSDPTDLRRVSVSI